MIVTKKDLRHKISSQCAAIVGLARELAAINLLHNLQALISKAQKIAIYNAIGSEISLVPTINNCIEQGKQLYHPVAYKNDKNLCFDRCSYSPNNDETSPQIFYNNDHQLIDEIKWYNLDLILLPLVAVDKHAIRLGYGGGYYDTTLAKIDELLTKPILCGVGFECQMVDKIPAEPWDVKLNYFISDQQVYQF